MECVKAVSMLGEGVGLGPVRLGVSKSAWRLLLPLALLLLSGAHGFVWAQATTAPAGATPPPPGEGHASPSPFPAIPAVFAPPALSVLEATIPELQEAMARGDLTSVALVETYLARIEAYDRNGARLNAILRVNPRALEEAAALDRERARVGVRGPLHGIPVIMKDNYDTYDLPTTGASVALAGVVPPDDAFQVARLREAGAIVLAKSNMHEAFGAVGWGTDTCGSIRIPSCFNNLFGLRPTKGLSSIDGIIPLAHTQDVGGPLARSVTDLAVALDATVGPDPADPATRAMEGKGVLRFMDALDPGALRGARLGIVEELFGDPPEDEEVDSILRGDIGRMVELGADTLTVEIPDLDSLVWPSGVINHEAKFDLMDYLAATPGAPVASLADILDQGLYHQALEGAFNRRERAQSRDSEAYRNALARREQLGAALLAIMDANELDALVFPSVKRRPALIGEGQSGSNCQVSAGSGFPAMALPGGFTEDGLPTGLELLGRPFDDVRLVAMAYAYEQAVHPRRSPPAAPPLVDGKAPAPMTFEVRIPLGPEETGTLTGRFVFDPVLRTLAFDLEVSGAPVEEIYAVTLHRSKGESPGPAFHRLMGPGKSREAGLVALGNLGGEDLLAGRVTLVAYTASHPRGWGRSVLNPG